MKNPKSPEMRGYGNNSDTSLNHLYIVLSYIIMWLNDPCGTEIESLINMFLWGVLLCRWQFCLSFHLDLPDSIRTIGLGYSKTGLRQNTWHTGLFIVPSHKPGVLMDSVSPEFYQKRKSGPEERAQQVKALAIKPGDLSSIPKLTWWREPTSSTCLLTSTQMLWMCVPP